MIRRNPWIRILLMAFIMYTISYIDRTNISLAIPGMEKSLGLTAAAIGFATGIFSFGYLILQIPAGRLASTKSAKNVILGLLLAWGLVSLSTAFVHSGLELTINRFVLGLVEGGVLTSAIILISHWFPREQRARANMVFLLSLPMASVIANPISGIILHSYGWQAMFIIEAIPAFIWAILWYFLIADSPAKASWLPAAQRDALTARLEAENAEMPPITGHWTKAIFHPATIWLTLMNFFALIGNYGFTIWLPSFLSDMHLPIQSVGLLSAVPYLVGAILLLVFALSSDHFHERKWHMILPTAASGVFMILAVVVAPKNLFITMVFLSLANGAFYARFGAFWTLPSEILPAEVLGVSIAVVNGVGNLGGFVGPYVSGLVRTSTHNFNASFIFLGAMLIIGALLAIPIPLVQFARRPAPSKIAMEVAAE
ncbi:MAG TPA: MFS transporter [Ktedonobacteraceae bacterium]|jgi:MFS family permease|nr:MFS transporter [Ktedonobacteraceae bacterium]